MSTVEKYAGTPPVVVFAGTSGSGKTSLLVEIIAELKRRGRKVAVIKQTHKEVETDLPGKDSWRFKQAGADAVALNSPTRCVVSVAERMTMAQLLAALPDGLDVALMEGLGGDRGRYPVIHVLGGAKDLLGENVVAVIGEACGSPKCSAFLPRQVREIADFLETRFITRKSDGDLREKV